VASSGIDPQKARAGAAEMGKSLPILSPEEGEALIREAGFSDTALFDAAFTFRGWIAHA
jgi:tRNA (cmo5U34)-methyltransferase